MDIAALSMGLSQMDLHQQASMSVMKMAMDAAEGQVVDMLQVLETADVSSADIRLMEQSVNPHLGGNIDIKL